MSSLSAAVLDSLQRLLPPQRSSALLQPMVQALIEALEQGELGLIYGARSPMESPLRTGLPLRSRPWRTPAGSRARKHRSFKTDRCCAGDAGMSNSSSASAPWSSAPNAGAPCRNVSGKRPWPRRSRRAWTHANAKPSQRP